MMATVPHVTSGLGLRKFQADGFLLKRVYVNVLLCTRQHIVIHAMQLSGVNSPNAKYLLVREGAENDLVRQCTFVHAAAYCHTRDATQQCHFSELTLLSCIACMTICCSVHKSALTYKEIIFSTFSNQ